MHDGKIMLHLEGLETIDHGQLTLAWFTGRKPINARHCRQVVRICLPPAEGVQMAVRPSQRQSPRSSFHSDLSM